VAGQLSALDAEALSFSSLFSTLIFKATARARPSYAECQRDPSFDPLCGTRSNESFPSGHANLAFTAAGLSCAHHLHLALYGERAADVLACAGTLTLAAATGTLRVLGDRHHATDVWFGALLGFAVGYGMPTLLHYGRVKSDSGSTAAAQPLTVGLGPTLSGTF
jgi:membrane-associated phospholipid phosphatase